MGGQLCAEGLHGHTAGRQHTRPDREAWRGKVAEKPVGGEAQTDESPWDIVHEGVSFPCEIGIPLFFFNNMSMRSTS